MTKSQDAERKAREAETTQAKRNEGSGAVPNVTEEDAKEDKSAIHEYEEKKGDWSKTGG
jgi:hypothetical protein